jgi:hypothetical protein
MPPKVFFAKGKQIGLGTPYPIRPSGGIWAASAPWQRRSIIDDLEKSLPFPYLRFTFIFHHLFFSHHLHTGVSTNGLRSYPPNLKQLALP